MADLFARHQARAQVAPPPRPAPRPAPAPTRAAAQPIERHPRGDGYELRAAGGVAVRVLPVASGWQVDNVGASHKRILQDRGEADRLAQRIARLVAL